MYWKLKSLVGVASRVVISIHDFVVFNKLLPTVECFKRRVIDRECCCEHFLWPKTTRMIRCEYLPMQQDCALHVHVYCQ